MNDNIFLSQDFRTKEFTESVTARKYGIDNTPPDEAVDNLRRLCHDTLQPLRDALGLPIVITSGFRTKSLNDKLAHASDRSQHMLGQAADFYVKGHTESTDNTEKSVALRRELLIKAFRTIILDESIDYDQLILYPTFIHVSYVSKEKNRRGILLAQGNGKLGYGRLTLANALKIS